MAKRADAEAAGLIRLLCENDEACLISRGDGLFDVSPHHGGERAITKEIVGSLSSQGLLVETRPGTFVASDVARSWLKRRANPDEAFRSQHAHIVTTRDAGDRDREVLVNLDESPIASLARHAGKDGQPWLPADLAAAAERLRRDFEIGRLQPRVTANWSASVASGKRSGDSAGLTDLTDMALAARVRVDRALRDVGPELSGVLIDVCCFLKGLETVERERLWPARSAKLALKFALQGLARHYGLAAEATGKESSGSLRHWGADDFRPAIT